MRLLRALTITIAVLAVAAGSAHAGTVSMTSHGLVVDSTADGDSKGQYTIGPQSITVHGEIASWGVGVQCDILFGACASPGPGAVTRTSMSSSAAAAGPAER